MDQETGLVLFVNEPANDFKVHRNRNFSMSLPEEGDGVVENIFDKNTKLFAYIDTKLLEDSETKSKKVVEEIASTNEYMSIDQIIQWHKLNKQSN